MDYLPGFKKQFQKFRVRRSFKEDIEPEEVLLDAEKISDFPDQKIERPLAPNIFIIFFGIILVGLIILIFRTGYFQILQNKQYLRLSERNSVRVYPVAAPRGLIYDRNLKPMVNNVPGFDVFLSPQDLPKNKNERDDLIEQICSLLDLNLKEINKELSEFDFEKSQRILLAGNLAPDKILTLESRLKDFPSVSIEESIIRQYPFSDILSHILGYTGKLNEDELKNFPDYFLADRLGKDGLEAVYEKILRGQAGERQVEVDAKGQQIKEIGMKDPLPGENLVTNIDLGLQEKIFEEMKKTLSSFKFIKAATMAVDPRNGQILSLLSFPAFNNNLFENNIYSQDLKNLQKDPAGPLFNRAIGGQYPSGSTIKPLLGAAALEEKVVTPLTIINDATGNITIVNQYNPNIVYNYPDWKAHGPVNIYSAIAQSCDVYFYTVGGGYGNIEGLGISRIKKYLELFGLGQLSGIDLPGEKNGLIPDASWKESSKNEPWFIGDTYHVSIGQGDLLVTPLQMTMGIAAVANGGKLFRPYLVDKIVDSDKNSIKAFEPHIIRENFIKAENLAAIRKGMREAVTSGSARLLDDLSVKVAGKTGTAQVAGQAHENAWFVGFAPYDDPKIVLTIMIENAGEGSTFAVPIAKEVLNWYFNR